MSPDELHLQIRNLRLEDYEQLKELMDAVYTDIGGSPEPVHHRKADKRFF